MKELTALEKTIWNLAMTGGQVMVKQGKRKAELRFVNNYSINHLLSLLNQKDHEIKPILHSLKKLTENVLEDGKVPIVELAKIELTAHFREFDKNKVGFIKEFDFENSDLYFENLGGKVVNLYFNYKNERWCFCCVLGCSFSLMNVSRTNHQPIYKAKKLFDQLRQWGFNIENLPEGTYVEKSTLKTE